MIRRFNNRLNPKCCVCDSKQVGDNSTCIPTTRPEAVISKRITGITLMDGKVAILFDDNTHITADMSILSDSLVSHMLHGNSELNLDSLNARVTALENKPDMDTVFDPSSLINRLNDLEAVDTTAFATKTELDNYVAKSDLVTVRNLENTQDLFKAINAGA